MKLILLADIAAKDDFLFIKEVNRDDQLAAHRVSLQLIGVVPNNKGEFGDVTKAAQVLDVNEIDSMKANFA